ncbi:MAG: beta-ketoacyl-[acyl-carrier-protein] synthase family protein [Candidatus Omnitrophica bacterium]|nr:beta-ketoacyl-[acyl-carrier-protein] synthase family protein [Candidatus Omnitrophota bacterium]
MKKDTVNHKKQAAAPPRVVVTGLGVVTSIGIGREKFWTNLLAGTSGISPVTTFDVSVYDRRRAGEIKDFEPEVFLTKKRAQRMGRASQMAVAASRLAAADAGLSPADLRQRRAAVCVGSTMGEPQIMERIDEKTFGQGKSLYYDFVSASAYPAGSIANHVAYHFDLTGPNRVFTTACASGNYAVGQAFDWIQDGQADCVLCGGSDALSRIAFTGFARLFSMAPDKCSPFDKNRRGMMLGEGAGILLLESRESAQKRGAVIYAEVLGYGLSCDGHHMTQPDPDGIEKAFRKAMRQSGVTPDDVDFICAHGTGTRENDKTESTVIHRIFGERGRAVCVNSIKSMLGHTMGAASAIEAVSCCLTLKEQIIAPTINFEEKDPECDIDCVPNQARKTSVRVVLNNASAFGGNNCCLVLAESRP